MDERAFEQMYRDNVRAVYAFARARLGDDEAADITAETFSAAVQAYRDGRAETVTTAWLMAVTKNKVVDRWRQAGRRRAKAHLVATAERLRWNEPLSSPEDRQALLDTLDKLRPDQRALLILHHLDGISLDELAMEMGTTESAIRSSLARARRAFRRIYQQYEERIV